MASKKTRQAGVGAKCSIIPRYIHPKQDLRNLPERVHVVVASREEKTINKKQQVCYTFNFNGSFCFANIRFCKIEEEGARKDFFDPPERQEESENFKEPKIKWKKSKAKEILTDMIVDGTIPEDPEDKTMLLDDIYQAPLLGLGWNSDRCLEALRRRLCSATSFVRSTLDGYSKVSYVVVASLLLAVSLGDTTTMYEVVTS